ncbi:Fibropellin-1 [Holothuria leucospilota]|uniref:Fibropellin-1 n=1 Tax=Holothuria leucospilota TaxID=206669 RepID=A0A9Q1H930_HOLLE|nr:Fibropellin-1 [Holothuria leucospilota]
MVVDTPPERFIDPIGTILSPNYPNPSPDRLFSYFYIVQIPEARSIEFVFEEFCTEREKDFLYYGAGNTPSEVAFPLSEGIKVFHGWQTVENDTRKCDHNVPHPFTIAGDSAWFRFDTDQNVMSQGFNLSYTICK